MKLDIAVTDLCNKDNSVRIPLIQISDSFFGQGIFMQILRSPSRNLFTLSLFCTAWLCSVSISAAEGASDKQADSNLINDSEPAIEELVTIGTRRESQTLADSVVPVDLYSAEQVESVNSSDLIDVLSSLVPSFSVRRQPISD